MPASLGVMTPSLKGGDSRLRRIWFYLAQMFPLPTMLVTATTYFFAIWFSLQALNGYSPVQVTTTSLRGIASVFLVLLLMRVYDELKDAATDLALGRAGDPLYRDRVLVTGAVTIEDVRWLRWMVTAALVALNVRFAATWASIAFWLLFSVMWLSFNWFFWPRMSKSILLAFVTHNPISLLLGAYVAALFVDRFAAASSPAAAVALVVGMWLPFAVWETSRKIRTPDDETAYQTYSRVLGFRTAALLPALFAALSAACLAGVAIVADAGMVFPGAVVVAAGLVAGRCLQFRAAPSRARANLKPWATSFVLVANVGMVAAIAASRGVAW
jgi:4-hydroxybenzoate polyprenyltransferase